MEREMVGEGGRCVRFFFFFFLSKMEAGLKSGGVETQRFGGERERQEECDKSTQRWFKMLLGSLHVCFPTLAGKLLAQHFSRKKTRTQSCGEPSLMPSLCNMNQACSM